MNTADSAAIKHHIPTRPREGRIHTACDDGGALITLLKTISSFTHARLTHISNPDLPDVSNPTKVAGFPPPESSRNCSQAAETSWTTPASTHPKDRRPLVGL